MNKESLKILRTDLDRDNEGNRTVFATDKEILLCVQTAKELIDTGNILKLEMLSAWAVNVFITYDNIAAARGLK